MSVGICFHLNRCPATTLLASTVQPPVRMLVFRMENECSHYLFEMYLLTLQCRGRRNTSSNIVCTNSRRCARYSLLWIALPPPAPQTPLSIKRTLYGSSQTRGILFVSLSNNDRVPITVGYLETLPALVTPWMHTMKADVNAIARGALLSYPLEHFHPQYCTQMTSYRI